MQWFVALLLVFSLTPAFGLELLEVPLTAPVTVSAEIGGLGSVGPIELVDGQPETVTIGSYGVELELVGSTIRATVDQALPVTGSFLGVTLFQPTLTMPDQPGRIASLIITLSGGVGLVSFRGLMGGEYPDEAEFPSTVGRVARVTMFVLPGDTITTDDSILSCQGHGCDSTPNPTPGTPVDMIRFQTLGTPPLMGAACGLGVELALVLPALMLIRSVSGRSSRA